MAQSIRQIVWKAALEQFGREPKDVKLIVDRQTLSHDWSSDLPIEAVVTTLGDHEVHISLTLKGGHGYSDFRVVQS